MLVTGSTASAPATPEALLLETSHRPFLHPQRLWRLRQRWNDLLFCHWPIPAPAVEALLPRELEVETFDGSAWVGVIPFWMDRVRTRVLGRLALPVPTTTSFPELNLRTYVRSRVSGLRGVYFFSLDCASPLAVLGARMLFHLPYFPAAMQRSREGEMTHYRSHRQLTRRPADYAASFAPLPDGVPLAQSQPGTLAYFLTERYCLFTPHPRGHLLIGHIHHRPWTLQPATIEIRENTIAAAHGITLPATAPVLHFSRGLDVLLWGLRRDVRDDSSYR